MSVVESVCTLEVLESLMVRPHYKWFLWPIPAVSLFLHCQLNCQKLSVSDITVYLGCGQISGKESTGVDHTIGRSLAKNCTNSRVRSVNLNNELTGGVRGMKNRCRGAGKGHTQRHRRCNSYLRSKVWILGQRAEFGGSMSWHHCFLRGKQISQGQGKTQGIWG